MTSSREIYRDDYLVLTLEREGALVRVVRSARAYPDVAGLEQSNAQARAALLPILPPDCCLLVDQRLAPGRNDPGFEQALKRSRLQLYPLFRKRAVLVQLSVGMLHVQRLQKDDNLERMVAQDEAALLRYLGF
jgi:hypothetical protein